MADNSNSGPLLYPDAPRFSWKMLPKGQPTLPEAPLGGDARVLPDHAPYPRGPTETALHYMDMQKQAIVHPTDKGDWWDGTYTVCERVHRDLHKLHAVPVVRKEERKYWSGHLNKSPERFVNPEHSTVAATCETCAPCESHQIPAPKDSLQKKFGYTLEAPPLVDGTGRMPVPQETLDTFRKFREANTITSEQWKP